MEVDRPKPVYKPSEATQATQTTSIEELVALYDWDTEIALAVMRAESGGNPEAFNPEWHYDQHGNPYCQGSRGLFQIACVHVDDPQRLFDPAFNVQKAYEIWSREGWNPWGSYTDKRYLKFL